MQRRGEDCEAEEFPWYLNQQVIESRDLDLTITRYPTAPKFCFLGFILYRALIVTQ